MKIQRTIPPAASPIDFRCLLHGLKGLFCGNEYLEKLGNELREYFDIKYVFLVSSGKAALSIALSALKSISRNRDEVIVPAYTCFSLPSAILKAGLKVVPCDVDPVTFDFDYDYLEKKITQNTLCIVPTHLFGIPADMDRVRGICKKRNIFVVEDAAQAMGGTYKNEKFGTIGDIGIFSLGRGKNITGGSGGIIVTNSRLIARSVEIIYSQLAAPQRKENILQYLKFAAMALFIRPALYWFPSGWSALGLGETVFYKDFPIEKMAGVNAALMTGWQRRLRYANLYFRRNARYLSRALDIPASDNSSVNLSRLPLIVKDRPSRDAIYHLSQKAGAGISRMYPAPITEIEEIKTRFAPDSCPQAKAVSERLLTLPTHHLLTSKDRRKICDLISSVLGQGRTIVRESAEGMCEAHLCMKKSILS